MDNDITPGLYTHFKGKEYRVLSMAIHTETLESLVIYQALYGEQKIWARPASMWNELVEKDGAQVARFQKKTN